MRKYLFNGAIIGSIFSGVGTLKSTANGPRDWRLVLTWVAWAATLAVAVGTIVIENRQEELEGR